MASSDYLDRGAVIDIDFDPLILALLDGRLQIAHNESRRFVNIRPSQKVMSNELTAIRRAVGLHLLR